MFKEKQLNCEDFYRGFITVRGMNASWIPLITLCFCPFFWRLFIWWDLNPYQFSTGLFPWRLFVLLLACIKLNVWLLLIRGWCLACWVWPKYVTLFNVLGVTSNSYLQGWFYVIIFWCVTRCPLSTYFRIIHHVSCIRSVWVGNIFMRLYILTI